MCRVGHRHRARGERRHRPMLALSARLRAACDNEASKRADHESGEIMRPFAREIPSMGRKKVNATVGARRHLIFNGKMRRVGARRMCMLIAHAAPSSRKHAPAASARRARVRRAV